MMYGYVRLNILSRGINVQRVGTFQKKKRSVFPNIGKRWAEKQA